MIRLKSLKTSLLVCLLAMEGVRFCAGQSCTGFAKGVVGDGSIVSRYRSSVLSVSGLGTAYLIDSDSGLAITAAHVIADVAAANKPLTLSTTTGPILTFSAHEAGTDAGRDISLLQLDPKDGFKSSPSVDISFAAPTADSHLFAMGYPVIGNAAQIILRSGDATFSAVTPTGLIEVAHVTEGGSSGGPLFDQQGDVIGTCHEEIDDGKLGRYVAMSDSQKLLKGLKVSSRMKSIEDQLVDGTLDEEGFKSKLQGADAPSSLELYVWLAHAANDSTVASVLKKFLICPIKPAVLERGIGDALMFFIQDLAVEDATALRLSLASREFKLGHAEVAYGLVNGISVSPSTQPDAQRQAEAYLLKGNIARQLGFNGEARQALEQAETVAQSLPRDQTAEHLNGRVRTGLAALNVSLGRPQDAAHFLDLAATNFKQSGDSVSAIRVLAASSQISEELGDYKKAISATKEADALAAPSGDNFLKGEILMKMGTLEVAAGEPRQAVKTFKLAHEISPKPLSRPVKKKFSDPSFNADVGKQIRDIEASTDVKFPD